MARRKKPTDEQQEPIKEKVAAGGTDQATPEASGTDQGQESPGVDLDRLRKTFATQWLYMASGLRGIADFFELSDEEKQPILEVVESLANVAADVENETAPEGVPYYYMYRAFEALDKGIDSISKARPAIHFVLGTARDILELKPYLQEELKKPEYQGKDIEQLALEAEQEEKEAVNKPGVDRPGRLMWEVLDTTLYMQAITAARAAKQAAENMPVYENLFTSNFQPLLNSKPTNELASISKSFFELDASSPGDKIYIFDQDEKNRGITLKIEKYNEIRGGFSVSAKKILDTAVMYLTSGNHYKSDRVNPTVEFRLADYLKACGYDLEPRKMDTPKEQEAENKRIKERIKKYKKNIEKDLDDLSNITWKGTIKSGNGAGDYETIRIISSHSIKDGIVQINFDVQMAVFLNKSYMMQFPNALLKVDNRNPNAYSIGRKIAFHNSNYNNFVQGTNNTLTVKSLLDAAPDIISKGELDERGARNWRDRIKKPLEKALTDLVTVGYLKKWEYRDSTNGQVLPPAAASKLSWKHYKALRVDFALMQEAEVVEYMRKLEERKAAERQAAETVPVKKKTPRRTTKK